MRVSECERESNIGIHFILFLSFEAMSRVWMGMSDIMEETVFLKLTDARKIAFTNWNDNEPNNHRGIEDCVEWVSNGKWNDAPCDVKRQFVCEMP